MIYKHCSRVTGVEFVDTDLVFSSSMNGDLSRTSLVEGKSILELEIPHEISDICFQSELSSLLLTGRRVVKLWDYRTSEANIEVAVPEIANCIDALDNLFVVGMKTGAEIYDVRHIEGGPLQLIEFAEVQRVSFHPCFHGNSCSF